MAINVNVQDLVYFPGNIKRVTIDQDSVVPVGSEGDEKYVLKFSTTAYSNITERTAIQDYYMTDLKAGWARSSGFTGNSGQFGLTSLKNKIMVMIDSTVSGTSNGYYEITLDYNDDCTPLSGNSVAADMEVKIRALADNLDTVDAGYKLAYKNASVEYKDGKFWIVSGSVSNFYIGGNRSYVDVISGSENDALAILGFDLKINSATLAATPIKEALVTSGYITGASGIIIDPTIGAVDGDCLLITDRSTTDYFQLDGAPTGGGVVLSFSSTAITNNYAANETKVQLLREQDPDAGPTAWFGDVDKITRHGVKTMINLIDFSE